MIFELATRSRRGPVLVLLTLLLAFSLISDLPARNVDSIDSSPQALREEIDRLEQASDYSGMILAAADLERVADTLEDRLFALRSTGRAYALLSDYDRALDALEAAVGLAEGGIGSVSFAELYRDTAGLLGEIGRFEQALSLLDRGLTILGEDNASDLRSSLLVMKGSMQGALGQLDEALSTLKTAMDLPLPTERQKTMRLNNLGMVYKWRGELEQALPAFETVLEQGRSLDTEQIIVYALLELGDVNRLMGNYDLARDYLEDALQRSRAAGRNRWLVFSHRYLAELEDALGNSEAADAQRQALAEAQARIQDEVRENRAEVLQVSLELLEREQRIERLQMESELQAVRLDRSQKVSWLIGVATALLVVALWLAIQQVRARSAANKRLDHLANTDGLTGLFNRRYLIARAGEFLAAKDVPGALGVVMIDLDHFKRINDRFGHEHGDAVLIDVAKRIQSVVRQPDIVARWGGEEFLALLPDCDLEASVEIAERLRTVISTPVIRFDHVEHTVTATLGVSVAQGGDAFEEALQRADEALYRAKREGRNRVCAAGQEGRG